MENKCRSVIARALDKMLKGIGKQQLSAVKYALNFN